MRLALVAACLLAVVAVTISPSLGNPAPGIKDWFKGIKEKIKELTDKKITVIKDKIKDGFRGRRDVDYENYGISDSSIGDVYEIIEGGSFEDDGSDLEYNYDDETAEDDYNEEGEAVDNSNEESGEEEDEESGEIGDDADVREEVEYETEDDVDEVNGGVWAD